MCDQTEVSYLENDVVWVKIGPIWWPGVVKDLEKDDEGKEILAGLKKKPIAAVKFFQEDNYEFVKNLDHIYHYNCRKKDEFIKKGLDKFRSGASHMKKFPADVTTAESLVQGDVNIINDPKFYPEKKQNYSEIFGSGKKKNKKESEFSVKSKLQTSSSPYRPITHKRFINKVLHGESDHKTKTLIQPALSPEDCMSRGIYKCHVCRFETSRVNVIVAHHRLAHSSNNSINWTGSDAKTVRRKPMYKSRKSRIRRHVEPARADSSDDESLDKKKLKSIAEKSASPTKSKGKSAPPVKGASVTPRKRRTSDDSAEDREKRPRFTDVLLADWSEDDEDDKRFSGSDKNKDSDREGDDDQDNPSSSDELKKDDSMEGETSKDETKDDPKNQHEKMSCFDFDEEEEGFIGMSNANTYGRKIPRVIPVKDKPELGVDLEIGELFKRKSESDTDGAKDDATPPKQQKSSDIDTDAKSLDSEKDEKKGETCERDKDGEHEEKTEKVVRRRRKSSKDQEIKVDENSLAVRRTRRPGAKKSYLNEVIEKIEENDGDPGKSEEPKTADAKNVEVQKTPARRSGKEDHPASSSRRKQDLKHQTMENSLEETVYTDILNTDQKTKNSAEKKHKEKNQRVKNVAHEDLTQRIDNLLAETSVPEFPDLQSGTESRSENQNKTPETSKSSNTLSLSFDYVSPESTEKSGKGKTDVKSITKMFSDTIQGSDKKHEAKEVKADSKNSSQSKQESDELKGKATRSSNAASDVKSGASNNEDDRNSGSLIAEDSSNDCSATQQVANDGPSSFEGGSGVQGSKKVDLKGAVGESANAYDVSVDASENATNRTKNVKTIKLKADALPSTLLSPSGKLKGQTIIHQKGGTYVILSQPPQLPRPKVTAAKTQPSSKFLIVTNQLGEQKIITTSGLQQSKYKIEPQKVIVASSSGNSTGDTVAPTSGVLSVGKTQPVIKMVPDGKGGVMKQLTVSPKKVLVGGTKVLVSGAGSTLSPQGSTLQKIALTSGNNLTGDYRLIENYKGSGKTVLIQGNSGSPASVLLKTGSVAQRSVVADGITMSPNVSHLKKKPKIVMRTTPAQGEFVVRSEVAAVDSPTYVMKRKGADEKFATRKIIRRPVISSSKAKSAAIGSKTYFLSSDQGSQKSEPLIIKANHEPANKIIRLSHKLKEIDVKQKGPQMIISKAPESIAVPQGSAFTLPESEEQGLRGDGAQVVELAQGQVQQPVLQTQVMAMPGPIGSDGNQTYVLVSVDERGVVQPVENSLITYETGGPAEPVFVNSSPNANVILINPQTEENVKPVFSNGSQDILAEALANTNVLEGSMNNEMESIIPSMLLPPSIPSSVVQETSVTLQKPIMTPLEMPTSVAPDTSGLEPPPLPPTPTADVLMEEQETELQVTVALKEDLMNAENAKEADEKKSECLIELKNTDSGEQSCSDAEPQLELPEVNGNDGIAAGKGKESEGDSVPQRDRSKKTSDQGFGGDAPDEEFVIENSQEEQGSGSFQSMPLLNDEPDTSDDAQGSEPIADQDFELQKSRGKAGDFSSLLREQEPPSSTNNEVVTEAGLEKSQAATSDNNCPAPRQEATTEDTSRSSEVDKAHDDGKAKDGIENKETQSMPIISDDGSVNSYNVGQIYADPITQKRFQEETEVTSTTDEFSNKDNNIV